MFSSFTVNILCSPPFYRSTIQNYAEGLIACHNSPIPIVSEIKCRRITLDSHHTWKFHIGDLLKKSFSLHSCLEDAFVYLLEKRSSNQGNTIPISHPLQARLRSILHDSVSNIQLQKLEKCQDKCICLVRGALNSTPIPNICAKTGIIPLKFFRNYLTDGFIAHNLSQSHPSLHQDILNILVSCKYS